MAFDRPTLDTLKQRAAAEIAQRLGLGTLLARGPLRVLSYVLAGMVHGLYGFAAWIARQIIPMTAEGEQLERHADLYRVTRKAAAKATGKVSVTGSIGATIPLGTLFQRSDEAEYATTAAVTLTSTTQSIAIRSVEGGAGQNADIGTPLTLSTPIVNVQSAATVANDGSGRGLTGGTDEETDEALRQRLRHTVRNPPGAGSAADWERWTLEVPGVTRAWVLENWDGAGTVAIAFTVDDDPVSIIPGVGKIAEVDAYLQALRPVSMFLTVGPPDPLDLDPEIELNPDTAEVRAEVEAALKDLLRREATLGGTLYVSHIREAISNALGEVDHELVSPTADVVAGADQILVLGTITWS